MIPMSMLREVEALMKKRKGKFGQAVSSEREEGSNTHVTGLTSSDHWDRVWFNWFRAQTDGRRVIHSGWSTFAAVT